MGHDRPQYPLTTHFIPWNELGPYAAPTWNSAQLGETYRGKNPASWRGLPLVGIIGAAKKTQMSAATRQATSSFLLVKLYHSSLELG